MSSVENGLQNIAAAAYSGMTYLNGQTQTMSPITPYLFITSKKGAEDVQTLNNLGVRYVISLSELQTDQQTQQSYKTQGIQLIHMPINDLVQQSLQPIAECVHMWLMDWVKNPNKPGKVVIHCNLGVSRAPSVVSYHLMRAHNLTFPKALQYIRQTRHFALPNMGFQKQLLSVKSV